MWWKWKSLLQNSNKILVYLFVHGCFAMQVFLSIVDSLWQICKIRSSEMNVTQPSHFCPFVYFHYCHIRIICVILFFLIFFLLFFFFTFCHFESCAISLYLNLPQTVWSHVVTLTAEASAPLWVRYALKKKNDIIWEFFPTWGGVFTNPKTFVNLPSIFLYAKFILRC